MDIVLKYMHIILFISGFGASPDYSKTMCQELQRLTQYKVHNMNLHHGFTLEEECRHVLSKIRPSGSAKYIIIGFSTGCLIAMSLTKFLPTDRVILCNPAEILTRLNYSFANSLIDLETSAKMHRNLVSYRPIWDKLSKKTSKIFIRIWKNIWPLADLLWGCAIRILGPEYVAKIYYHFIARHVNEPAANEMAKLAFRQNLTDLRKTIIECILKPSLFEKIQGFDKSVHILEGMDDDIYVPYVKLLFDNNKNVSLHRTFGDHHMIYHHPISVANKLSSIIPRICPFV